MMVLISGGLVCGYYDSATRRSYAQESPTPEEILSVHCWIRNTYSRFIINTVLNMPIVAFMNLFMYIIIKLVIRKPTIELSLSYITYYSYISPYKLVLLLKVTWFQKQNTFIRGNITIVRCIA